MAAPGFSVTELLQAFGTFLDIWNKFFDEFDSAPSRIRELNDNIILLEYALRLWASFAVRQDLCLPLRYINSFTHKLLECRRFINRYKHLIQRQQPGQTQIQGLVRHGRFGRDTIRYAFDKDALKLKNDIILEYEKLNMLCNLLQTYVAGYLFNRQILLTFKGVF